jgi:hypothetical protein
MLDKIEHSAPPTHKAKHEIEKESKAHSAGNKKNKSVSSEQGPKLKGSREKGTQS